MVTEATRRDCASISRLCISLVPCECKPTVESPSELKQLFLANRVNSTVKYIGRRRVAYLFHTGLPLAAAGLGQRPAGAAAASGRLARALRARRAVHLIRACRTASCSRLHLGLRMRLGMRSFMRFREATHALYGPDSPPPQHSSRPAHAARLREAKHALDLGPVPNSLFSWSCASAL